MANEPWPFFDYWTTTIIENFFCKGLCIPALIDELIVISPLSLEFTEIVVGKFVKIQQKKQIFIDYRISAIYKNLLLEGLSIPNLISWGNKDTIKFHYRSMNLKEGVICRFEFKTNAVSPFSLLKYIFSSRSCNTEINKFHTSEMLQHLILSKHGNFHLWDWV